MVTYDKDELIKKMDNIDYTAVLSDPETNDNWQGATGFVHETVLSQFEDLSGFDIYMSGPPPMINAAKAAFIKQGAKEDQMFSDAFEYSADAQEGNS